MSPDILLFISDQHAPQYQADGQMPVDTPNLAALREQGTAFDAAYTPCPLCVPARMAMLSGLAPHHTGIFTNNDTLPQTTPTFLHAMAAAGYETVLVGRMHFIGPDQRHGFPRRVAPDFTNSGWVRPQKTLEQDFGVHTQTMGYKWCIDVVGGGAVVWSRVLARVSEAAKADHGEAIDSFVASEHGLLDGIVLDYGRRLLAQ